MSAVKTLQNNTNPTRSTIHSVSMARTDGHKDGQATHDERLPQLHLHILMLAGDNKDDDDAQTSYVQIKIRGHGNICVQ